MANDKNVQLAQALAEIDDEFTVAKAISEMCLTIEDALEVVCEWKMIRARVRTRRVG